MYLVQLLYHTHTNNYNIQTKLYKNLQIKKAHEKFLERFFLNKIVYVESSMQKVIGGE